MKALVTGASGFIGSTLIELLNRQGIEVRALMRQSSSEINLQGLHYERVTGDVLDYDSLCRAVEGCDYVFHLAGLIAAKDTHEYFRYNAEGTQLLAKAAAAQASGLKRFVFVSSLAAGGPATSLGPRKETDPDQPVSAYGKSKLAGEKFLLQFKSRFPVIIVRPPMVYGPKDKATLILVRTAAKKIIPLVSARSPDRQKYYSLIHAADLAKVICEAGTGEFPNFESGGVYYASSGEIVTYQHLMEIICKHLAIEPVRIRVPVGVLKFVAWILTRISKVTGRQFMLNEDKMNEIIPDYWTCSNLKMVSDFNFEPEYDLNQGMANAVGWYKKQGWI